MNAEYIPTVVQVQPQDDYKIKIFFSDGKVTLYDASHLIGKGVFAPLANIDFFFNRCTVLNNTLAWDLSGNYDKENCLDIDPETLYETV